MTQSEIGVKLRAQLEAQNWSEAEQLARTIFADESTDEAGRAFAAMMMYEHQIESAFDLLEAFVERYPESLYLPRVCLADLFARASMFDTATEFARLYLRIAKENGLTQNQIVQEGVMRCNLIVTCGYTQLGARSYSKRFLQRALQQTSAAMWVERYEQEINLLTQELALDECAQLDHDWDAFFSNGQGAAERIAQCQAEKMPVMAERVELLASLFRLKPGFSLDEHETLMLIYKNEKNISLLN